MRHTTNIPLVSIFGIIYASQALIIGLILFSYKIPLNYVGDFWAAMAVILFLANVCGIGSDRFLSVYIPRIKKYYLKSFKNNLINIFYFFLALFLSIAFISLMVDTIVYLLLLKHLQLVNSSLTHPVELCFFCIFFFMCANFLDAFLRSEGFQNQVMQVSIICYIVRILLVFLIVSRSLYFNIGINYDYDLVFTLSLVISAAELIKIIGYSFYTYKHFATISRYNGHRLYMAWKKDVWHYALYALQYDWIIVGAILVEMFAKTEKDPAIFGYLFGIVRLFYILSRIVQQITRDKIVKIILDKDNILNYLKKVFLVCGSIFALLLIILNLGVNSIMFYYKIPEFIHDLHLLLVISMLKALIESVFLILIFVHSYQIMKFYVHIASVIYAGYITMMIYAVQVNLAHAVTTYIWFYSLLTLFELVLGLITFYLVLKRNKQAKGR